MEVENGRFNYRVIIDMLIKKLNTSTWRDEYSTGDTSEEKEMTSDAH